MKSTTVVLLALLMALTACGSKPDQQSDGKKDGGDDRVKFAQCMRENGIEVPDPKDGQAGVAIEANGDGSPPDMEKMKTAHEACKKYLPNGGEFKPPSPEEQDKMRKQAKCMRDKSYDWPDPKFEGGGSTEAIKLPDMDDPKVKQDMKDCGLEGEFTMGRAVG